MTTPEGRIKNTVKKALTEFGAYYHMVVQNGMGAPSLDFVGCHKGAFFAIETKAGNKGMTPRQEATADKMRKAGAKVFLINEETDLGELINWLTRK